MAKQSYGNIGTSPCGLLTLLFVGLKLTGNIGWSWLWVLSPLWIVGGLLVMVWLLEAIIDG